MSNETFEIMSDLKKFKFDENQIEKSKLLSQRSSLLCKCQYINFSSFLSTVRYTNDGDIIVSERNESQLIFFSKQGVFTRVLDKSLNYWRYCELFTLTNSNEMIVCDTSSHSRLVLITADGQFHSYSSITFGSSIPSCINFDKSTNSICVGVENQIHAFKLNGESMGLINSPSNDFDWNSQRDLISVDSEFHVNVYDSNGSNKFRFGGEGSGDGEFQTHYLDGDSTLHVCVDHQDRMIVSDYYGSTVQLFDTDGSFLDCYKQVSAPNGVACDSYGNLAIADVSNRCVQILEI